MVSLAPANLDMLGVRAGDRNLVQLTFLAGGLPLDLTGATIEAQARLTPTDAAAAVTGEIDVTDAAAGQLDLRWPGDDVRTLLGAEESWSGVWDLQSTMPGEDPVTLVAGRFTAAMDVTRP